MGIIRLPIREETMGKLHRIAATEHGKSYDELIGAWADDEIASHNPVEQPLNYHLRRANHPDLCQASDALISLIGAIERIFPLLNHAIEEGDGAFEDYLNDPNPDRLPPGMDSVNFKGKTDRVSREEAEPPDSGWPICENCERIRRRLNAQVSGEQTTSEPDAINLDRLSEIIQEAFAVFKRLAA